MRTLRSERRRSDRRRRILDRYGEADADEHALLGRVEQAGDDADDLAVGGHQWAAGITGIGGGIELNQVGEKPRARARAILALEARNDAGRSRRPEAEG